MKQYFLGVAQLQDLDKVMYKSSWDKNDKCTEYS
jgi:hypothetical protein